MAEITAAVVDQRTVGSVTGTNIGLLEQVTTPEPLNNGQFQYMKIHNRLLRYMKIRKNYSSIHRIYTIDIFPKYTYLHHQASPSITVT